MGRGKFKHNKKCTQVQNDEFKSGLSLGATKALSNCSKEDREKETLSPLSSEYYVKRGFSREQAEKMAELYTGFDEFEREFALDYLDDQDYLKESLPIKEISIDGETVPVVEFSTPDETIFVSALLYEGNSIHPEEIEIDEEEPATLLKSSYGTYETVGKRISLSPKKGYKR